MTLPEGPTSGTGVIIRIGWSSIRESLHKQMHEKILRLLFDRVNIHFHNR